MEVDRRGFLAGGLSGGGAPGHMLRGLPVDRVQSVPLDECLELGREANGGRRPGRGWSR